MKALLFFFSLYQNFANNFEKSNSQNYFQVLDDFWGQMSWFLNSLTILYEVCGYLLISRLHASKFTETEFSSHVITDDLVSYRESLSSKSRRWETFTKTWRKILVFLSLIYVRGLAIVIRQRFSNSFHQESVGWSDGKSKLKKSQKRLLNNSKSVKEVILGAQVTSPIPKTFLVQHSIS